MPISTRTKKYTYWFASFMALFIILLAAYYHLGGFLEIQTAISKNNKYSLAGKEARGKPTSKGDRALFGEMKGLIASGALKGTLSIVNYRDGPFGGDGGRRFVGILLEDDISMIPSGFSVLEIESETTFRAALIMHPLVMPNTEKVEAKLKLLADSRGVRLRGYTLEKLYGDNSVIVEMFAR